MKENKMPRLGPMELVIILLIVVLLFGGRKIPQIAKGLGKGIRDFKASLSGDAAAPDENAKTLGNPKNSETDHSPKT